MTATFQSLFPDVDSFVVLEPEELGLRLLPLLNHSHRSGLGLSDLLRSAGFSNDRVIYIRGNGPLELPEEQRKQAQEALREAWAWLVGAALLVPHPDYHEGMMQLSRRARKLAPEASPHRAYGARLLPKSALHIAIRENVWALYQRGIYDSAAFEAMKAVEVAVREAAKLTNKDLGVPLMRKAFDKSNGPLTDLSMDEGEREARAHLFAGAIGAYKNPHSHRNVLLDDPDEAAEIIMLANHLLRIVSGRRSANEGR